MKEVIDVFAVFAGQTFSIRTMMKRAKAGIVTDTLEERGVVVKIDNKPIKTSLTLVMSLLKLFWLIEKCESST